MNGQIADLNLEVAIQPISV